MNEVIDDSDAVYFVQLKTVCLYVLKVVVQYKNINMYFENYQVILNDFREIKYLTDVINMKNFIQKQLKISKNFKLRIKLRNGN